MLATYLREREREREGEGGLTKKPFHVLLSCFIAACMVLEKHGSIGCSLLHNDAMLLLSSIANVFLWPSKKLNWF